MKNTQDMNNQGTRWTTVMRWETLEKLAGKRWGATEFYRVPSGSTGMDGRGPTWMVRFKDGWRYCHADNTSAYCAAETFKCDSGREAWLNHQLGISNRSIESAEALLIETIKRRDFILDELQKYIQKGT